MPSHTREVLRESGIAMKTRQADVHYQQMAEPPAPLRRQLPSTRSGALGGQSSSSGAWVDGYGDQVDVYDDWRDLHVVGGHRDQQLRRDRDYNSNAGDDFHPTHGFQGSTNYGDQTVSGYADDDVEPTRSETGTERWDERSRSSGGWNWSRGNWRSWWNADREWSAEDTWQRGASRWAWSAEYNKWVWVTI